MTQDSQERAAGVLKLEAGFGQRNGALVAPVAVSDHDARVPVGGWQFSSVHVTPIGDAR